MVRDKKARIEVVKIIIGSQELSTQEELLTELTKAGYACTQATLSRDLKKLRIVKAQNAEGRYVYVLPENQTYRTVSDRHATVDAMNRLGALSVRFSGNMAVIRTLPGHASHVAYDIDHANLESILGTVAGDDTIFVVLQENIDRSNVLNDLASAVPTINN